MRRILSVTNIIWISIPRWFSQYFWFIFKAEFWTMLNTNQPNLMLHPWLYFYTSNIILLSIVQARKQKFKINMRNFPNFLGPDGIWRFSASAEVASSRKNSGLLINALAMATRCFLTTWKLRIDYWISKMKKKILTRWVLLLTNFNIGELRGRDHVDADLLQSDLQLNWIKIKNAIIFGK